MHSNIRDFFCWSNRKRTRITLNIVLNLGKMHERDGKRLSKKKLWKLRDNSTNIHEYSWILPKIHPISRGLTKLHSQWKPLENVHSLVPRAPQIVSLHSACSFRQLINLLSGIAYQHSRARFLCSLPFRLLQPYDFLLRLKRKCTDQRLYFNVSHNIVVAYPGWPQHNLAIQ